MPSDLKCLWLTTLCRKKIDSMFMFGGVVKHTWTLLLNASPVSFCVSRRKFERIIMSCDLLFHRDSESTVRPYRSCCVKGSQMRVLIRLVPNPSPNVRRASLMRFNQTCNVLWIYLCASTWRKYGLVTLCYKTSYVKVGLRVLTRGVDVSNHNTAALRTTGLISYHINLTASTKLHSECQSAHHPVLSIISCQSHSPRLDKGCTQTIRANADILSLQSKRDMSTVFYAWNSF